MSNRTRVHQVPATSEIAETRPGSRQARDPKSTCRTNWYNSV